MTLFIHLIRHGESTSNISSIVGGVNAVLTDRGVTQAERLGDFLRARGMRFDEVHCSTYVRAIHTASLVCKRLGFETNAIRYNDQLIEIDRGDWDGRQLAEVFTDDEKRRADSLGMDYRTPNGESMHDVGARMFRWALEAAANAPEDGTKTIGVVTHGHAIRCLMERLFGITRDRVRHIGVDNTSITTIRYDQDGWILDCLNTIPHLIGTP